jgi:hypothetical protein
MIISLIPDLHGQVFESAGMKKGKKIKFKKSIYIRQDDARMVKVLWY